MMMSPQLGGEPLPSAWREVDAKFLSNPPDRIETNQVSPGDRLDQILSHSSLYIRGSDLILYFDNVGMFHLKQQFQKIVDAVFGYNTRFPGWALRSITKSSNPREAGVVLKLLGAQGSIVTLATRLLEDPGFGVEVGLDKLPFALSQRILQGDVPPYFSSRLCVTDPYPQTAMTSPIIKCLRLNSFEYFFMAFAGHICTLKGAGNTSDYLVGWGTMTDNLYNNLMDDYLAHFFPCNGHGVPCDDFRLSYQQVNDTMFVAQSLRSHMNMSPETSSSQLDVGKPRLLKSSLLLDHSTTPTQRGDAFFRKTQIQKEVWRTETILMVFTEMWMAHAPGLGTYQNMSPVSTDQYGKVMLPTVDVVKSVRMLVRHSHFFLNCISSNVMHPMEELKRDVYPTYQKRLYKFLRHLFFNWPLDNSFRIVYETWLSYVQPWRYVHFERIRSAPSKEAVEEPVDHRWFGFIQENILFYTKLFSLMINRMDRVDFATTKNAMMFYRVAKVFTVHEYLKVMLMEIEHIMLSYDQPYPAHLNGISARSPSNTAYTSFGRLSSPGDSQRGTAMFRIASLKQMIKDWENADFNYEPLFSEKNKKIMFSLIESSRQAKNQLQTVIDATLVQQGRNQSWWDKILGANKQYNAVVGQSINELTRAINQLEVGANQFATFFEIVIVEPPENLRPPVFTPTKLPTTSFIGNSMDGWALEGSESRITVLPSGTYTCDMLVPIGNPDYVVPRSDECGIVVSWMRDLSGLLNVRFAGDIMRLYFQKNWKGRLARATFAEPVEYFDIEKRGRVREKVRKVLPPRISLRFLSSTNFLLIVAAFFTVFMFCGSSLGFFFLSFLCWSLFILIRAITEPETKLDDVIYLFGNRNYNVDFMGRKERLVYPLSTSSSASEMGLDQG